jgi:hypothetical protein
MAQSVSDLLLPLLERYGKQPAARDEALAALGSEPPPWLRWLGELESARVDLAAFAPLPLTVLPVGLCARGLLALDPCAEAVERGRLPVVLTTDGRFFRHLAPSLAALPADPLDDDLQGLPFSKAVKRAPAALHLQAAEGRAAQARGVAKDEAARVVAALRRPLHTASSDEELAWVFERALALDPEGLVDPLTLRLARAGFDATAWRTVGAERAIAGKSADAIRALEGAQFLGAPSGDILPILERLYVRSGAAFGPMLAQVHEALRG